MDNSILVSLIGLGGVVLGSMLNALVSSILERSELKHVKAEKEKLDARYRQLERDHLDLLDKELFKTNSRRLISFQLLVLDRYLLRDRNVGRSPMLEILGINLLGPLHQGRELVRDILKSKESGGYGGKVRILLLDPNSKAFLGEAGRMVFEADGVGRLAAEMCASLYILADIRENVGREAFAYLDIRLHSFDPDRSLMMLDVCATTPDRNATTEGIISTYPDGVILENPYSRRRGERGLEGESRTWTLRRGGGENYYQDNVAYFRRLWLSAKTIQFQKPLSIWLPWCH